MHRSDLSRRGHLTTLDQNKHAESISRVILCENSAPICWYKAALNECTIRSPRMSYLSGRGRYEVT